jgi:hypothetical protein
MAALRVTGWGGVGITIATFMMAALQVASWCGDHDCNICDGGDTKPCQNGSLQ